MQVRRGASWTLFDSDSAPGIVDESIMVLVSFLFLLPTPTPAQVAREVPERMPALLTLIYLGGLLLIVLLLLVSLFRNRRKGLATAIAVPEDLPQEVKRRLGSTSTNRGLRGL